MRYEKELPVAGEWDVLVCGAGPSGLAAAVSAARSGLKTAVLERYGCVGGCMTVGNVTTLMGDATPGGIWQEVMKLVEAPDHGTAIDPEAAKERLLKWLLDSGAALYPQTPVIDVLKENNAVKGVMAATMRGPAAFLSKCVIDATGDGYAAAIAGAEVMYGRDEDGLVQPVSLMYHIEGVDPSVSIACRDEEDDTRLPDGTMYLARCEEAARNGELPSDVTIVRLYPCITKGEYLVNATQRGKVNTLDTMELLKAEKELRGQIEQVNNFLKKNIPGFVNIRIRVSGSAIGVRESRRIRGRYILQAEDILEGRRFDDAVAHRVNFCIDIHNPTGGGQAEKEGKPFQAQDYDIPLRCLQPLGVENLILCGRSISGSHRAHASYRVMCIAMAIGQAAAMTAKAAVEKNIKVSEVDAADVQTLLATAGCRLRD
ncbi:MAG: FAD-dependent oxidoreductase [Treponema sp.]|nr:FAD-dependent oxidoreductase [Treponema sp.]